MGECHGISLGRDFRWDPPDAVGGLGLQYGISAYDISYLASFIVMVAVLVYTIFAISEGPRPLNPNAIKQGFANVPRVISEASMLALKHPTLSLLLAALALFLFATNPVEVIWPTYAKPMLSEGYANTAVGTLTACYFFSIAFGASLSSHISRIFKRRHAVALAALFVCLAAAQVGLATQGGIVGFVGFFCCVCHNSRSK